MKRFALLFIGLVVVLSGCELLTKNQTDRSNTGVGAGKDLIVNEVFTIPPDKYYAYSWIELYNPTRHTIRWFDQTFPATGSGVGTGGMVTTTTDDGSTWTPDDRRDPSLGNLNSIIYPNPDSGYMCGDAGKIYRINAGGITNVSGGLPAGHDYSKINFYSISGLNSYVTPPGDQKVQVLLVVGDSGLIFRSANAGGSWAQTPPPRTTGAPKKTLRSIYTNYATLNFFVVGDSGSFFQSGNAGTTWTQRTIPEPYRGTRFNSCWFVDSLGWAVGENGTILASTNKGTVWAAETSHVNVSLRGCFFAPSGSTGPRGGTMFSQPGMFGWVVGDNGTILRTATAGATWLRVPSGTTAQLNSVYFVDSVRGWTFGNGGVILATTDGGLSWFHQQSGTSSDLRGGHFRQLSIVLQNGYYLQMHAQRNYIFYDAATNTLNFDFITRTDTGAVLFQPQDPNIQVASGGFAVITNDSIKFHDHTALGPGQTTLINFGFGFDTSGSGQLGYNAFAHILKWNLLPSSEIRLIKFFYQNVRGLPTNLTTKVIDVVRWGGFRPTPDDYPSNEPAGFIPEYWSLARYNNDPGEDPSVESTAYSFYMSDDPLPGWYSQQSRP